MAVAALAFALIGISTAEQPPPASVTGRCTIRGKTLAFDHVYFVRGTDRDGGPERFVLLSAGDVGPGLAACEDMTCAAWKVVKAGIVLEPEADGAFWMRAVHPEIPGERQASYRGFVTRVDEPGRLAGKLSFTLDPDLVVEVEFDAPLTREFPSKPRP